MTHSHNKSLKGFSLVELIVAVGLFAMVMTIATTAYLVMININREAQNIATGTNNLAYALESMTRNIRTGTRYSNCGTNADTFSFYDISGVLTTYKRETSVSDTSKHKIVRVVGGTASDLTDELIDIKTLAFTCSGTSPGGAAGTGADDQQAYVTIIISGTTSAGIGKPVKTFNVQTSATMRRNDLI